MRFGRVGLIVAIGLDSSFAGSISDPIPAPKPGPGPTDPVPKPLPSPIPPLA